jgi:hypothetical protein
MILVGRVLNQMNVQIRDQNHSEIFSRDSPGGIDENRRETSFKSAGIWANIWNRNLENMWKDYSPLDRDFRFSNSLLFPFIYNLCRMLPDAQAAYNCNFLQFQNCKVMLKAVAFVLSEMLFRISTEPHSIPILWLLHTTEVLGTTRMLIALIKRRLSNCLPGTWFHSHFQWLGHFTFLPSHRNWT